jgi:hypothetical protein
MNENWDAVDKVLKEAERLQVSLYISSEFPITGVRYKVRFVAHSQDPSKTVFEGVGDTLTEAMLRGWRLFDER